MQDGKGLAPELSSELSSHLFLPVSSCLHPPPPPPPLPGQNALSLCRLAHMPHGDWSTSGQGRRPPGPAGILSHPLPPPPPERSVPIPSPFSARDTGSRRGHSTDRYKHTGAPGNAHRRVPQRGTDTGFTQAWVHSHTHTHAQSHTPKETRGQSPLAQIPAGRSRPARVRPRRSGKPTQCLCPWC